MASLVEEFLKNAVEHGLSVKQLKTKSGLSKNNVKRILFHSNFVKDTDPYLHGSGKQKIHVYSYQPFEATYIKRKMMKNHKKETIISIKKFMDQINKNIESSSSDDGSSQDLEENLGEEFEML